MADEALRQALEDLKQLSFSQNRVLQASQLRERLSAFGAEELLGALRELRKEGITVEAPLPEVKEGEEGPRVKGCHSKSLGAQEKEYAARTLADMLSEGALPVAMQSLLEKTLSLAEQFYCEEILWEDLVQEACMALFQAVGEEEKSGDAALKRVEEGLVQILSERVSEKQSDEALVEKVEKLEEAVRELNEGEGEKFTIAELAVILDMDVEDIHGILRLTGDDEGQSSGDQGPSAE